MPRRKRSAGSRTEVKQPVTKKVSKSPLGLFEIETRRFIPIANGIDKSNGSLDIGSFQLNFQASRITLASHEEDNEGEDESIPCLNRALVVLEDDTIWMAIWEDYTLQLLSVTEGLSRELMWALCALHYKGLSLHVRDCSEIMEMFPCDIMPCKCHVTIGVAVRGDTLVCTDPCEVPRSSLRDKLPQIRELMLWLHPSAHWVTDPEVESFETSWNVAVVIDDFYRHTKQHMCVETFDWYNLNVEGVGDSVAEKMFSVLRPYQWRAVGWMLAREGAIVCDSTITKITDELANIWSKLSSMDGRDVFYNPHTGRFCEQLLSSEQPATISGGILADEMGLGKTVEVLALILSNQWTGCDDSIVHQLQQQVQPLQGARLEPPAVLPTVQPIFTPLTFTKNSKNNSSNENKPHIIACVCGAMTANNYVGTWVSCDACDLWYHTPCVKFDQDKQEEFICVRCLYTPDNPVVCSSTLIVSPVSIAEQWLTEIGKHIKPGILKVLHYRGIKLDGYITPPEMASYDIVLTTYEVLKTEVYFSDNLKEFNRVLRHPKKYIPPRTPLSLLYWWRICLDEAQMIEGKYTNAARMVQQLSAAHRWCVTGTPLQLGVYDLYGLLFFLRVEPYVAEIWWKSLLWKPFAEGNWTPMLRTCSKLLWRNSKLDVAEELQLPPHSECVHWLTFSPVERHFYRKTLGKCANEFESVIHRFCYEGQELRTIDNHTVSKVLAPLRHLRQACCHPQLVKNGYLVGSKGHVTMAKLLEQLTKRAKNEVNEALRVLVSSCNGIAAIYQIKHQWQDAVDMYRHVIKIWEKHSTNVVNVDRLPRIHTLENLADLLDADHCSVSDGNFSVKANQPPANSLIGADQCSSNTDQCSVSVNQSSSSANQCSANTDQSSNSIDQCSASADQSSNKTDQCSVSADQGSNSADQNSSSTDQCSVSADQGSNSADQSSINTDQCSAIADQCSYNTNQCSYNTNQCSTSTDQCSGNRQPLRDEDLRSEARKLKDEYLKKFTDSFSTASNVFQSARDHCMEIKDELNAYGSSFWWDNALEWSCVAGVAGKLMEAVAMEMNTIPSHAQVRVTCTEGLQYLLLEEVEKLEDCREEVLEWMGDLMEFPSEGVVQYAAACHLRPIRRVGLFLPCQYCDADEALQQLQNSLYMKITYNSGEEYSSRADGFLERILKSVNTFVKYHNGPQHVIREAKDYFALLEAFKKEFKAMKEAWLASHGLVAALDELDMSKTKLELMRSHRNNDPSVHLLEAHEIEPTLFRLRLEKAEAEQELKKVLGQLLYLDNLNKVSDIKGENTDPCPICVKPLGCEWAVMTCGHCLCTECCDQLLQHHRYPHHYGRAGRIQCPLCREMCHADEIGAVSTTTTSSSETEELKIEGSYSTKIKGIIMAVLSIRKDHPDVKMIIFSMWSESLELVAHGLKANGVKFLHGKDQKSLQKSLHQFKEDDNIKVMLLPTYSGSKGLNLTEASHVILCEPSLNKADEHQAIGRVYRMGQTKPTVVHRLYIKDSVEEKIRTLIPTHVSSNVQKKVYHDLTLEHVRELLST